VVSAFCFTLSVWGSGRKIGKGGRGIHHFGGIVLAPWKKGSRGEEKKLVLRLSRESREGKGLGMRKQGGTRQKKVFIGDSKVLEDLGQTN